MPKISKSLQIRVIRSMIKFVFPASETLSRKVKFRLDASRLSNTRMPRRVKHTKDNTMLFLTAPAEGQITSQNSVRDFLILKSHDFFCDFL